MVRETEGTGRSVAHYGAAHLSLLASLSAGRQKSGPVPECHEECVTCEMGRLPLFTTVSTAIKGWNCKLWTRTIAKAAVTGKQAAHSKLGLRRRVGPGPLSEDIHAASMQLMVPAVHCAWNTWNNFMGHMLANDT